MLIEVFQIDTDKIKYGVNLLSYPMKTGLTKHSCGKIEINLTE